MLYRGLRQRGVYQPPAGLGLFFIKLLVALAVLGVAVWFFAGSNALWPAPPASSGDPPDAVGGRRDGGVFHTLFALGFRVRDFPPPPPDATGASDALSLQQGHQRDHVEAASLQLRHRRSGSLKRMMTPPVPRGRC